MLDALFLQETKIDGQFYIPNFKLYRKDVNSNTGGIMMYFRSDLGQQRRRVRSGRDNGCRINFKWREMVIL